MFTTCLHYPLTSCTETLEKGENVNPEVASMNLQRCSYCGNNRHPRRLCPAKDRACNSYGKEGHWACVCLSSSRKNFKKGKQVGQSAAIWPTLATLQCVNKATGGFCKIIIGNEEVTAEEILYSFDIHD